MRTRCPAAPVLAKAHRRGRRAANCVESLKDDGHWDIWLMNRDGGSQHQLTNDPGDENRPTWSRDGGWIYFSSDRSRGRDIWQVPVSGGQVERVTKSGSGLIAFESADGRAIMYQTSAGDSPLVMVPLTGGPVRQLVGCVKAEAFAVGIAGIHYSPCGSGPESPIYLLDPATGQSRPVTRVSEPFRPSRLAISPDGNTILVHRSTETADLMLIENFR